MKKKKYDSLISILNDRYLVLEDELRLPAEKPVELDLGCGSGDMTIGLGERYPERMVLAADVMLGRLRKVASKATRANLQNVHLLRVEARYLCTIILSDASMDRVHILCPDPWPKYKHKAHRLMSSDFMMHLHRILKPGGVLHFATDDVPYLESATANLRGSGLFDEDTEGKSIADIADITTEFERQWLAQGKKVTHTAWIRKG